LEGDTVKLSPAAGIAVVAHPAYVVILNVPRIEGQQSPYVFKGPAFDIWTLVDGTRDEDRIVTELVEATDAKREVVARDTHAFIAQLLELGLIEEVAD
jgi:hypothetical protein